MTSSARRGVDALSRRRRGGAKSIFLSMCYQYDAGKGGSWTIRRGVCGQARSTWSRAVDVVSSLLYCRLKLLYLVSASTSVRGGASKRVVTLSECAWARTRDDARPYSRDYEQPMTPSSVNRETGLPGSGWGRPSAQEIVKQQGYGACKSRRSDDVAAAHLSSPQRLTAPPPPPIQTRQCP